MSVLRLDEVSKRFGGHLLLAIARAWMARPTLMLLDEPSLGLAPLMVAEMFRMIAAVREQDAVLLVEQNTRGGLRAADRGYALERLFRAFGLLGTRLQRETI